ncbi:PREDICTED: LOW QUALITY PROTEIN: transmembrane protein 212 [Charadrius vociferus]|uniref:LOW QUALITY PROTEIN: transmembrane protein 212 n=1 Tax=Charadrius vociferus TaxID=50402 RepID=UPI0005214404|nr:PREDICTED: LOW QUALITY PROTEIN: transmembrane protein 212 [Charadrius vociferus]
MGLPQLCKEFDDYQQRASGTAYGKAHNTIALPPAIKIFAVAGTSEDKQNSASRCQPWFIGGSVCLASPIWNGALWEASFAFGIPSITGASVNLLLPIACLLLGPYFDWYHLTLQILDLCSSLAIFCASLGFVTTFARLHQCGHLNMSIGHGGEGELTPVMPLAAARRVARLCKDWEILNALTSGSVVPLKPCASFH